MTPDIDKLTKVASQVRRDIVRMVHACQSGHPGGSLGCADYLVALYFHTLKHNTKFSMDGHGEDLFFLSNGHISPVWYSVLARSGYFEVSELATFRKLNTRLQGHPTTHEKLPGVRVASGSLGQGMSVAIGAALAKKANNDSRLVFSLHGDGELQEGQMWESAMYASHNKVDNLISTIDVNGQQIDGTVDSVLSLGDLKTKWESFGWKVILANGNNYDEISETLRRAKHVPNNEKPIIILMQTIMGKGVDFMENSHKWHGSPPSTEQLELALAQLPSELGDY
jgi:transketolase